MGEVTILPIFCLCDAEDGEKTSVLGIERGKNKELTHYKITVDGPFKSCNQSIQFEALKSEMSHMVAGEEVILLYFSWSSFRITVLVYIGSFHQQFSSRAFAVYEAYRGTNIRESESTEDEDAFVRLECSWKNPSKIFELPHIASQAKVVSTHQLSYVKWSFQFWCDANRLFNLCLVRLAAEPTKSGVNWTRSSIWYLVWNLWKLFGLWNSQTSFCKMKLTNWSSRSQKMK